MEQELNAAAEQRLAKIQESGAPIEEIRVAEEAVKTELEKQLELVEQLVTAQGQLKDATDAKFKSEQAATGRAGKGSGSGPGKEILGTLKSGLGNVISTALKGGDVKAAIEQLGAQMIDKAVNILMDQLFASLEKALAGPAEMVVQGGADMAKAGTDVVSGAAEQVSAAAEGAASAALEQSASAQMTAAATQQVTAATQMVTAAAQQMAAAQIMASTPGFADGGRPPVGEYAWVGERGPELVKFDNPATVYSNEQSRSMVAAMDQYSPGNNGGGGGADDGSGSAGGDASAQPMNFSFSTVRIADEEYVDRTQLQAAMASAAQAGAKQGEAMTLRRLQMSPGSRRKAGL